MPRAPHRPIGPPRTVLRWFAAVSLAVLAVAACQDDPEPVDAVPTPTAAPPPPLGLTPPPRDWKPVPGLFRPDGAAVDVVDVELTGPLPDASVEVVRTREYRWEVDDHIWVHDLANDGTAVVSLSHLDDFDGGKFELLAPERVALWPDAGMTELKSSALLLPGEPFRSATNTVAVGDSVVWLETTPFGGGPSSWRVFRASPDGDAALLARSEDVELGDHEVVAPFPESLVATGGRASWALEGLRPDGTVSSVMLSVPLDGDAAIRTESESVTLPAATGTGIAVVRLDGNTGVPTGIEVLEQAGQTRHVVGFSEPTVDVPRFVRTLVAERGLLAWVLEGSLYVTGPDGPGAHRVRVGDDVVPASIAACDGRVVWAQAVTEGIPRTRSSSTRPRARCPGSGSVHTPGRSPAAGRSSAGPRYARPTTESCTPPSSPAGRTSVLDTQRMRTCRSYQVSTFSLPKGQRLSRPAGALAKVGTPGRV